MTWGNEAFWHIVKQLSPQLSLVKAPNDTTGYYWISRREIIAYYEGDGSCSIFPVLKREGSGLVTYARGVWYERDKAKDQDWYQQFINELTFSEEA